MARIRREHSVGDITEQHRPVRARLREYAGQPRKLPGSAGVSLFREKISSVTSSLFVRIEHNVKSKRHGQQAQRARSNPTGGLWHPEVPGPLWNGTRRVGAGQIQAYCRVVAREFRPNRIILFGSCASGSTTRDSDLDLVVVMPFRGSATDKVVEFGDGWKPVPNGLAGVAPR